MSADTPEHTLEILKAERTVLIRALELLIEEATFMRTHGGRLPNENGRTDGISLARRTLDAARHLDVLGGKRG